MGIDTVHLWCIFGVIKSRQLFTNKSGQKWSFNLLTPTNKLTVKGWAVHPNKNPNSAISFQVYAKRV